MSRAEHSARVDALFDRALDLGGVERAAFLDTCEPGIRAEVEELLRLTARDAAALEPGQLAQGPLWDAFRDGPAPDASPAGQRIGGWRLVRELGRGGMGTVFLAERAEGPFPQRAALKVVRWGVDSEEILQRFEQERRILASLTHAHIARLLDGGSTTDGRPFFVMEYVDGRPIDAYCDEKQLGIGERLELFLRVGKAVEHAHRNLVVHRDVKPSNIVVTDVDDVKLLDFGIAKLLSPDGTRGDALTRTVARVLTPDYASPEQVRGDPITTASDVYQLGLLLYELLTGERAQRVEGVSAGDVERVVCQTAPPRPSSRVSAASPAVGAARGTTCAALARRLRGDLDTIVQHALRKEPDRRYASVGELLEDIERFRAGRPIRARRDTWTYRARKFAVRHRAALAWSLSLAVIAAGAVVTLARQRLRAARDAERAGQIESMFVDLFNLPNPRTSDGAPRAGDFVAHAVRRVRRELDDQPDIRSRLLTQFGRSYLILGQYQEAIEVLEESLATRQSLFGSESPEVADTLEWLGRSQHYTGRYALAEKSLREASRIRRRTGPQPDAIRMTLELGDFLHSSGRLSEAEALLRDAVAVLRSSGDDHVLVQALGYLANTLRDRGALSEAEALYREAQGDENDYARLLILKGDLQAAEALLVGHLVHLRRFYAGDHPLSGTTLRYLGHLRMEQGRFAEAEASLAEAQSVFLRWLDADHPMMARTRVLEAELARRRGRNADAAARARAALDHLRRLGLKGHPASVDACRTLGEALPALSAADAAALDSCLAYAERELVAGDPRTVALRQLQPRAQRADPRRR